MMAVGDSSRLQVPPSAACRCPAYRGVVRNPSFSSAEVLGVQLRCGHSALELPVGTAYGLFCVLLLCGMFNDM